jgi:hypothetical protein
MRPPKLPSSKLLHIPPFLVFLAILGALGVTLILGIELGK